MDSCSGSRLSSGLVLTAAGFPVSCCVAMSWGGDRQGGRENKKSSLRSTKRNLHDLQNKKDALPPALPKSLPPTPLRGDVGEDSVGLVDGWAALFSRQFDRDREAVLRRATNAGVRAIVCFSPDITKQHDVVKMVQLEAGLLYCCVGVHPDNIKRTNDKQVQDWNTEIRGLACVASCVGMYSGLDFSREMQTHYMQERILETHVRVAAEIEVPLIIHMVDAFERLYEMVVAEEALPVAAVFHTQLSTAEFHSLSQAFDGRLYLFVTGLICENIGDKKDDEYEARLSEAKSLVSSTPRDRLIFSTNSPHFTPQSIPDAYMREGRNEPENLPFICEALGSILGISAPDAKELAWRNMVEFFALRMPNGEVLASEGMPEGDGSEAEEEGGGNEGEEEEEPRNREVDLTGKKQDGKQLENEEEEPDHAGKKKAGKKDKKVGQDDDKPNPQPGGKKKEGKKGRRQGDGVDEDEMSAATSKSGKLDGKNADEEERESSHAQPAGKHRRGKKGRRAGEDSEDEEVGARLVKTGPAVASVRCRGCSASLFPVGGAVGHLPKQGGKGSDTCLESTFLHELAWFDSDAVAKTEGRLECPNCSCKLGDYSFTGIACGCGAFVAAETTERGGAAALVARFMRKKIEFVRDFSSAREAADEALGELDGLKLADDDDDDDSSKKKKDRKSKKKMQLSKYDNVSNMGRFRDKDFHKAPAARNAVPKGAVEAKSPDSSESEEDD